MSEPFAAKYPLLVSREQGRNKIRDALRLFVGTGRRYSVKSLANATGVPDWQINQALIDGDKADNRPLPPEALLSLMLFLGSDFTNEWLHLAGQGAFDLPDDDVPPPGEFAADIAGDGAEVARMAADGEFCGDDRKRLRAIGQRKIERGMVMVAMTERRGKAA